MLGQNVGSHNRVSRERAKPLAGGDGFDLALAQMGDQCLPFAVACSGSLAPIICAGTGSSQ